MESNSSTLHLLLGIVIHSVICLEAGFPWRNYLMTELNLFTTLFSR